MKKSQSNKDSGKGDKPRSCYSEGFKKNFEKIDWKKLESKAASSERVYNHPKLLSELLVCLLGIKSSLLKEYLVTDESIVADVYSDNKRCFILFQARLKKLEKKYDLKEIEGHDLIWEVVEKMHGLRPF